MNKPFNSQTFKFFLPYFLLAVAIILAFRVSGEMAFFTGALGWFWGVISPFFAGFIVAYIVNIPISGIQKLLAKIDNKFVQKRQRMLSVISVVLILAGLIALTLNLVIPAIVNSVEFFIANWDIYWASILNIVENFNEMELFGWTINEEMIFTILSDMFAGIGWEDFLQPLNALMGLGTAVFNGVIAFIASIYILVEKNRFKRYLHKLIGIFTSGNVQIGIIQIFARLNNNVRTYIRTQTIDGIILGSMAMIILWILGSPYAVILGIMLGIVNYIPYFGSIFGTIVAVIVVIFTQDFTTGAIAAAAIFVAQQIDANIIQPRLMSGSFSLSPLLVIISITFGGAIAGIIGMFVAIPVIAVLKDIFDSIVEYYELKKFGELKIAEDDGLDDAN
jgi:predicted PurR-regulated permease PerM